MFGQLCVADAGGVAAGVADPLLAAVVPDVDDVVVDEVVDAGVDEWLVAALATARLPPNPTPSAPAPTAVAIAILPSRDFNVSASSRSVVLRTGHPRRLRPRCSETLPMV